MKCLAATVRMYCLCSHKLTHKFVDRSHPVYAAHIGTAEYQTVLHISFNRCNQCLRNTVWHCCRVTFLKTIIASCDMLLFLFQSHDKPISDSSPRHSDRALYNLHIRLIRVQISMLIGIRCVTTCTPSAPSSMQCMTSSCVNTPPATITGMCFLNFSSYVFAQLIISLISLS